MIGYGALKGLSPSAQTISSVTYSFRSERGMCSTGPIVTVTCAVNLSCVHLREHKPQFAVCDIRSPREAGPLNKSITLESRGNKTKVGGET